MGVTLVNTVHTNRPSDVMDLVELAHQVQKVRYHNSFKVNLNADVKW